MSRIILDEKRNGELKDLLVKLSDPSFDLQRPEVKKQVFKEFETIYSLGEGQFYRHLYSDFFDTITEIDDSSMNDIETLVQNIRMLCLAYNPKYSKNDIGDSLYKLYDHISLDVKRLQYTKKLNYDYYGRLISVAGELEEAEKSFDSKLSETISSVEATYRTEMDALKEGILKDSKEDASKMRAEYISILGIFSSVVLAFVGGMAFSTSVLENVNKASIYRMVLIAFIIGIVFYNIIWLLFDVIKEIREKGKGKWYVWLGTNLIFVLGIVFVCLAYKFDWFARENKMTEQKNQQVVQEVIEEEMPEEAE